MKNSKFFSVFLLVILTFCMVYFLGNLWFLNVLKFKYFALLVGILIVIFLIIAYNLNSKKSKLFSKIFFSLVCIILAILFIYITSYLRSTKNFLVEITSSEKVVTKSYVVLSLKNSKYDNINYLNNKVIGMLDNNDGNIDTLKKTINYRKVLSKNLQELISCLKNGIVDAIVLENNFYYVLSDNNATDDLKIIYEYDIEEKETIVISDKDDRKNEDEKKKDEKGTELNNNSNQQNNETNHKNYVKSGGSYIFYISGSDSRGGLSNSYRSDVNIVAVVNTKERKILLIHIPRDYYVPIAGINASEKLTHIGLYGVNTLSSSLENLLDMHIDNYLKVGFNSVIKSVDVIGGIDLYSDTNFRAFTNKNCYFSVGVQHVNGDCALAFARERYAYLAGDRHRGENQEQVISSIIKKVDNPSTLVKYNEILNQLNGSFETNMSYDQITSLIKEEMDEATSYKIETYNLNGSDAMRVTYMTGMNLYVMIPDYNTVNIAKNKIREYTS